jgi:hypothetical protein
MSDQEVVGIREVQPNPTRKDVCPEGCKDKNGEPRLLKKLVNAGPRVKRLEGGATKQITVQITKRVCDKCGHQTTEEKEL